MHLEIEMGKLERHQYALNIMRKRIKMLMAGDEDYWAKLERLLKTSNTHKCTDTLQERRQNQLDKLHSLMQAYQQLKKEEMEIVRSIRNIDDAFLRQKNFLRNQNKQEEAKEITNETRQLRNVTKTHTDMLKLAKGNKIYEGSKQKNSQTRQPTNSFAQIKSRYPVKRSIPERKTNPFEQFVTQLRESTIEVKKVQQSPEDRAKHKQSIKQRIRARFLQQKENFICRY